MIKIVKGLVISYKGKDYKIQVKDKIYNCNLRGKFRKYNNQYTNPISIGDYVDISINDKLNATIIKIYPRMNFLARKNLKNIKENIIASNVDQLIIMIDSKNLKRDLFFLDKFLVISKLQFIKPIIIFNKMDIINLDSEKLYIEKIFQYYHSLGYNIYKLSLLKNFAAYLIELFKNKMTVISGKSGVGKSTLIKKMNPDLEIKIKKKTKKNLGQHTTTFSQIYEIYKDAFIIDTPGIQTLIPIYKNIKSLDLLFPEIFQNKNCYFKNCTHINEKGCTIIPLVNSNILQSRYDNYKKIYYYSKKENKY